MAIYSLNNISPSLPDGDFWVSETAQVIGNVKIGNNCIINCNAIVSHGSVVGNQCIIAGGIVTSEVRITKDIYESKDKAVTPGGLKVFGGDEMYRLNKIKSHI